MPDLAVYNLTTLTGLLGPAKAVVAMTSVVTPTRKILGNCDVRVSAEDNAMVLIEHGGGLISHVQSGFNYFSPKGHFGSEQQRESNLHFLRNRPEAASSESAVRKIRG